MGNGKLIKCTPLANSATEQLFFLGKNFFEIYFNGPIFITFTDYFSTPQDIQEKTSTQEY